MSTEDKETKPVAAEEPKDDEDDEEDDDSDAPPALEPATGPAAAAPAAAGADDEEAGGAKRSKSEKKSKKAMARLGMRPVPGVRKATIRRTGTMLFVIQQPEVFRNPSSDTYILFGEAKMEDMSAEAQRRLVEQLTLASQSAGGAGSPFGAAPAAARAAAGADALAALGGAAAAEPAAAAATAAAGEGAAAAADGAADGADGDHEIGEDQIKVVMSGASVGRAEAIAALKKNKGDIVSAVVSLTV